MRIVAGTYEGFCYGWESSPDLRLGVSPSPPVAPSPKILSPPKGLPDCPTKGMEAAAAPQPLSMVFGYNVHVGCVKCVAIATSGTRAGQLLVTGGVDERVRIYDVRDRTEVGELQQHNGTITCMEFYKSTHLLTGSEDHSLCIWRVHDWALLHVLGGHKAAVTSLSIHPSGRMALSVSRDRTLRLWNLLEGRCAYIKRLQGEGELVRWSRSGDSYLVVVGSMVMVYSAATSEPTAECQHNARVNSASFTGCEGTVATCCDDKTIRFFRAEDGKLLGKLDVSEACSAGRIRDMCHVENANQGRGGGDDGASEEGSLVTVTSTGGVDVWGVPALNDVAAEGALTLPLLATHHLKGEPRLTCVTACLSEEIAETAPSKNKNSKKRKQRQQQQRTEGESTGGHPQDGGQENAPPLGKGESTKKKSKPKKAVQVQVQGAEVESVLESSIKKKKKKRKRGGK